jgi:hypothetical protein
MNVLTRLIILNLFQDLYRIEIKFKDLSSEGVPLEHFALLQEMRILLWAFYALCHAERSRSIFKQKNVNQVILSVFILFICG